MDIIKHGKTYQELDCMMCEAKIGVADKDIQHTIAHDAYGGGIHETVTEFVYCPECGCRIVLSLSIDGKQREIRRSN